MDIKRTIYVANLPKSVTEDQILGVFKTSDKKFKVEAVEIEPNEKTDTMFARVELATEKLATAARNRMNGLAIDDYRIAVTPAELPDRDRLSSKQQKVADRIIETLGETEKVPVRQINAMVMLCGTNFAEAILEEALVVDAEGGMVRHDGEEKRTPGGIFFYLARHRMPRAIRRIIYNRRGKMPLPEDETTETIDTDDE